MAYTPPAGSPLALGTHPRLHVTDWTAEAAKIAAVPSAVSNLNVLIGVLDTQYTANPTGILPRGTLSHLYAYVGNLNLTSIPGSVHAHAGAEAGSTNDYRQRAHDAAMAYVNDPAAKPAEAYFYNDLIETSVSLAYDWCFDLFSSAEKTTVGRYLIQVAEDIMAPTATYSQSLFFQSRLSLWSTKNKEGSHPYIPALAVYGDGLLDAEGHSIDDRSANVLDTWSVYALNGGYIDAANWVGYPNGGQNDPGNYCGSDSVKPWLDIDAWRTATGENYFVLCTGPTTQFPPPGDLGAEQATTQTIIRLWPKYFAYVLEPWNKNYVNKHGQSELNNWSGLTSPWKTENNVRTRLCSYSDADMASLNLWNLTNVGMHNYVQLVGSTNSQNYSWLMCLYARPSTVVARSPTDLGFTRTCKFTGEGLTVVRDGFTWNTPSHLFFVAAAVPHYYVTGHSSEITVIQQEGTPAGFTLQKHGPLFGEYYIRMRFTTAGTGWHHRRNMTRFTDVNNTLIPFGNNNTGSGYSGYPYTPSRMIGTIGGGEQASVGDVVIGNRLAAYRAGIRVREYTNDTLRINSILIDQTNFYCLPRVVFDKRHYVLLGQGAADKADYLVIKEKALTQGTYVRTRFELCCPYVPTIDGTDTGLTTWNGYTSDPLYHRQTTDSTKVICRNDTDDDPYQPNFKPKTNWGCNGKGTVNYLLPASRKITIVGGNKATTCIADNGFKNAGDDTYSSEPQIRSMGCYFDCEPATQTTDTDFLVVIQASRTDIADAAVSSVTINTGNMHGAYIADADEGKVVLFTTRGNTTATVATEVESAVNYTISHTGTVRHVLNDMDDSIMFDVAQGGVPIVTAQTPVDGVLTFTSTNGGTFAVTTGAPVTPKYFVFRK